MPNNQTDRQWYKVQYFATNPRPPEHDGLVDDYTVIKITDQTDHIDEAGEYNPADLENIKLPEDSEKIQMRHNPPNQTDPLDEIDIPESIKHNLALQGVQITPDIYNGVEAGVSEVKAAINAEIAKAVRGEYRKGYQNGYKAQRSGYKPGQTKRHRPELKLTTPEEGK